MNLSELEVVAGRILDEKKRLKNAQGELERVERDLREEPRRSEKDKRFYALIGLDWEEPAQIREKGNDLKRVLEAARESIKASYETILKGLSDGGLVVPLDPNFANEGQRYIFKYRMNAVYVNSVQELSDLLGLPVPLTIDNVVIMPDRVEVREDDSYFAKERIVEAFEKITKAVALKLSPRPSGQSYS